MSPPRTTAKQPPVKSLEVCEEPACQLQDIDPYTYLVDVLQRVSQHPASKVIELTPRAWKEKFAENPLRSDLDGGVNDGLV